MKKILLAGLLATAAPAYATSITDGHLKLTYSQPGSQTMGTFIRITGEIVSGDSDSFDRLVARAKGPTLVILSSPGGSLMDGLAIGESIKNHKFMTAAEGTCASACAYAWLAGDSKAMGTGAEVIFHSPFAKDDEGHADGTAGVVVGQYLAEIGIDLKTSMQISGHGPDDYYVLSAATKNPIVAFTVVGGQTAQSAPAPEHRSTSQNIIIGMTCYPAGGYPYYVAFNNDARTISITGSITNKAPVTRVYPAFEVNNDQRIHVLYVAAKRDDQERILYSAFDYSKKNNDVSAIRTKAPGSDLKDKCQRGPN